MSCDASTPFQTLSSGTGSLSSSKGLPPEKAREAVLIALFALSSHRQDEVGLVESIMEQLRITRSRSREALAKARCVLEQAPGHVARLSQLCEAYQWHRVGKLEQSVLILGAYELSCEQTTPAKVVLAEATRLAKKFGSVESARFVNALLDAFWRGTQLPDSLPLCDPRIEQVAQQIEEGAQLTMGGSDTPSIDRGERE